MVMELRKVSIIKVSTTQPKKKAPAAMLKIYAARVRLPKVLPTTTMEAMLVAGPAMSSTNAAPGGKPLAMRAKASGMEPVEQVYMGMEINSIANMQRIGYSRMDMNSSSGTNAAIKAPRAKPISNQRVISGSRSPKPYSKVSFSLPKKP